MEVERSILHRELISNINEVTALDLGIVYEQEGISGLRKMCEKVQSTHPDLLSQLDDIPLHVSDIGTSVESITHGVGELHKLSNEFGIDITVKYNADNPYIDEVIEEYVGDCVIFIEMDEA